MMKAHIANTAAAVVIIWAIATSAAQAGDGCRPSSISGDELIRRANWATAIVKVLERQKHEIAILARVGSDASEYGLRYTHAGLIWRTHPKGTWTMIHVLNNCGSGLSNVHDQGLLNFLLDDPYSLDILILGLAPRLQNSIAKVIKEAAGNRFHHPRYSMLAYPFSTKHQNSNQWLMEILAVAEADIENLEINDRRQAQAWLRARGFRGTEIRVSRLKQSLAGLAGTAVSFNDHPTEARNRDQFETTTVRSIRRYLSNNDRLTTVTELRYPYPEQFERRLANKSDRDEDTDQTLFTP